MKYAHVYVLFLLFAFFTSCGAPNKTDLPKEDTRSETKDTVTYSWSNNDTAIQIRKGSNGSILIVSYRHVFRYDGNSFTNLTGKLGAYRFIDALEDRKGNLWFASIHSGVYYYPSASLRAGGKSFQHFTTREGLADNRVLCIYEDRAGIIWFATRGGASSYDGKSFRNFKVNEENWITTFMEDKSGNLWIGTRSDVSIYDGKKFTALTDKSGQAVDDVFSMIEDKEGNIWFGGWDGLRRYDGKTFTKFEHNKGYAYIIEDENGNIWTSGLRNESWVLSRYDQKSLHDKKPTVAEIMSGPLRTFSGIFKADDGSIWFGNNGGLYRYDGKTIHVF